MASERSTAAVGEEVRRAEGFDPAASTGLFVGVSKFEYGEIRDVPYAVDDAVDLAHLFSVELGLLPPGRAVLALAGEPKKPGSRERLEWLLGQGARRVPARRSDLLRHLRAATRASGPEGLFVLAVATHGLSDRARDLILGADALLDLQVTTGVEVSDLFFEVANAGAPRRLVLLDACRNPQADDREIGRRSGAGLAPRFAEAIARAEGQTVISATNLGGYSYDDPDQGNGVFTAAVLEGLRGAALVDDRGFITARTLAGYLQVRVAAWVRKHASEDADRARGIETKVEGPAESLPLAVDPERESRLERYRARREAALALLGRYLPGARQLSGALFDQVKELVPESGPARDSEKLLEEIEALESGGERAQRSLRDLMRELLGEVGAGAPHLRRWSRWAQVAVAAGAALALGWGLWSLTWERRQEAPLGSGGTDNPAATTTAFVRAAEPEPADPVAGTRWYAQRGMPFRFVPEGIYTIGSPEGEPGRSIEKHAETRHPVRLTRGFWIGETEITQQQWGELVAENPSSFKSCGGDCPVEGVNWFEAVEFANRVSKHAGLPQCYRLTGCTGTPGRSDFICSAASFVGLDCSGYRLPTEAEWEVAARAGTPTANYIGGLTLRGERDGLELDSIAWYGGNSKVTYAGATDCSSWPEKQFAADRCGTHPVAGRQPNPWNLHDMLGNVWEWTGDWGIEPYPTVLVEDPTGLTTGSGRVIRGGSWYTVAGRVRAAARDAYGPGGRGVYLGFRLSRSQGRSSQ